MANNDLKASIEALKNEISGLRTEIGELREGDDGLSELVGEIQRLSLAIENLTAIMARR